LVDESVSDILDFTYCRATSCGDGDFDSARYFILADRDTVEILREDAREHIVLEEVRRVIVCWEEGHTDTIGEIGERSTQWSSTISEYAGTSTILIVRIGISGIVDGSERVGIRIVVVRIVCLSIIDGSGWDVVGIIGIIWRVDIGVGISLDSTGPLGILESSDHTFFIAGCEDLDPESSIWYLYRYAIPEARKIRKPWSIFDTFLDRRVIGDDGDIHSVWYRTDSDTRTRKTRADDTISDDTRMAIGRSDSRSIDRSWTLSVIDWLDDRFTVFDIGISVAIIADDGFCMYPFDGESKNEKREEKGRKEWFHKGWSKYI
jgi:hypothetical protein